MLTLSRRHVRGAVARGALLAVVLGVLWVPVVLHYHVQWPVIADGLVEAARSTPPDHLLQELGGIRFFGRSGPAEEQVAAAEELLRERPAGARFDPADLDRLFVSSLGVPRRLLAAYDITRRREYLSAAQDYILAWRRYEQGAWLPKGLMWNDHAVAERMLVLVEFWRLYRHDAGYSRDVGRQIIELAVRHAMFLSKAGHFTFNTNHGVMQNLALFHFCLAFPGLPDVNIYKGLAIRRLNDQFGFYINDEGVVLEHSPEYHRAGLEFLTKAMRYLTLLDMTTPPAWIVKYRRAKSFYAQLRLPDGHLPLFGDTPEREDAPGPLLADPGPDGHVGRPTHQTWAPGQSAAMYQVAGWAVWWDGLDRWPHEHSLAQTVVGWSHFPRHGHPRANELSVWFWAGGQAWWSNVGLWPYGDRHRVKAVSWTTSNAPHLVTEHGESFRRTVVRASAWSERLAFLDLERSGGDGYMARRQIVWRKPDLWVVLDDAKGKHGRNRIVWTPSSDVSIHPGPVTQSFTLRGQDAGMFMDVFFLGSPGTAMTPMTARLSPFVGWSVVGSSIKPATSLVVEQPVQDAWALAVSSLHRADDVGGRSPASPTITRTRGGDNWRISVRTRAANVTIERGRDEIAVSDASDITNVTQRVAVEKARDVSDASTAIDAHFRHVEATYRPFKDYVAYRVKFTWLVAAASLVQEIVLAYLVVTGARVGVAVRWLALVAWPTVGVAIAWHFSSLVEAYTRLLPYGLGLSALLRG